MTLQYLLVNRDLCESTISSFKRQHRCSAAGKQPQITARDLELERMYKILENRVDSAGQTVSEAHIQVPIPRLRGGRTEVDPFVGVRPRARPGNAVASPFVKTQFTRFGLFYWGTLQKDPELKEDRFYLM